MTKHDAMIHYWNADDLGGVSNGVERLFYFKEQNSEGTERNNN